MWVEQGYGVATDLDTGKVIREESYFACCHCHRKVPIKTLHQHQYGICFTCDDGKGRGLKCDKPECQECSPFYRRLEAEEARAKLRSML